MPQNGRDLRYQKGFFSVYQPGLEHADIPETPGVQLCVGISGCGAEKLPPGMLGPDSAAARCAALIIEELKNPRRTDTAERLDILAGWLVLELRRASGIAAKEDRQGDPAETARKIFDSRFAERIDMRSLAESLYVSPDYFRHIFKKSTGESPLAYLIRRRLECAGEMLRLTDLPVSRIADSTGWENVYYFSRIFHRRMGVSPSGYRVRERRKASGRG
jgi:transcriptional regulator GlxA family with amidase domain